MFEGDYADTCDGKFTLVSMGGRAEGLACADPGARTPIGASGIMILEQEFWKFDRSATDKQINKQTAVSRELFP